jgi:DNA polymerase-3 subunit delta
MMPRALRDRLDRFARGEAEGIFLVHGEEDFLVEETARQILSELAPQDGARAVRVIPGGKGEVDAVLNEMAALSFLTPELAILVRNSDLFGEAPERDTEAFLKWLQETPALPHPIVFTVYDRKGDKGRVDKRRRVYKAIERRGAVHEHGEMKAEDANVWVAARFRQLGKHVEPAAARLLVERTGVALGSLANEIDKIALYAGDEPGVSVQTIEALVGPSREEAIWSLTDHVLQARPDLALRDVARLVDRSGENPLGILLWLAREMRSLLEARAFAHDPRLARRGPVPRDPAAVQARWIRSLSPAEKSLYLAEGYNFLGMHPWAASVRLATAARFPEAWLRDALIAIARAERHLKTGGGRDRAIVEETILALSPPEGARA